MAKNKGFEKKLLKLEEHGSYEGKIGMIWGWLHTGPMSFGQFKAYMKAARKPKKINEDPEEIMA